MNTLYRLQHNLPWLMSVVDIDALSTANPNRYLVGYVAMLYNKFLVPLLNAAGLSKFPLVAEV